MNNDRFLIIHFGDNDFGYTLNALGEYILSERFRGDKSSLDVLSSFDSTRDLAKIATTIFRNLLCINQHRFDLHGQYQNDYNSIVKQNKNYMDSDYFVLAPYFSDYHESDLNSECLVIDLKDKVSFVV